MPKPGATKRFGVLVKAPGAVPGYTNGGVVRDPSPELLAKAKESFLLEVVELSDDQPGGASPASPEP